jgi:hypothetical protein
VPEEQYVLKLWLKLRAMLLEIDNQESEWIRRADDVIKQFDDMDPRSFSFRYPADKHGAPALPNDLSVDPSVVSRAERRAEWASVGRGWPTLA